MSSNPAAALAATLLRHTVGFDQLPRLTMVSDNYPPHNVERIDDDHFRLTLACAGFSKKEIELSFHNGVLTITGKKATSNTEPVYLHQGIAFRDFVRQFPLAEHIFVSGANLDDGLLVIDLERDIPPERKPKLIPIG